MTIAPRTEIIVDVPATQAGAFAAQIKDVIGEAGTVTVDGIEEVKRLSPGKTLKLYREVSNYTQAELAAMLNTSANYVCKLENGKKTISKPLARDLAKIFQTGYKMFL